MKLQKKAKDRIDRALSCLKRALSELEKAQGFAMPTTADLARGSSYRLHNPKCVETCANLAEHVNVYKFVGSNVVMAWTAKDILESLLREAES